MTVPSPFAAATPVEAAFQCAVAQLCNCCTCRLGAISLVNKRFHALCGRPSSIWADLELRIGWVNDPTARSLGLLRFLQRRLPVLRRLDIKGSLTRPLHVSCGTPLCQLF